MELLTRIYSLFWTHYLRSRGAKIGKGLRLEGRLYLLLRDGASLTNLIIGDNVTLGGRTFIRMRRNGKIILHDAIRTGTDIWLVTANDAVLEIGEKTILGSYSIFNGGHGLKIGSYCIFAAFVYVNSSDHGFEKGELIQKQPFSGAPIYIGDDVWLGGQIFINKGVSIGDGTVIGAGAVLTKDIPAYKIAVGNPAKVIRDRE
jgi:galactoside O-acetyltransferase